MHKKKKKIPRNTAKVSVWLIRLDVAPTLAEWLTSPATETLEEQFIDNVHSLLCLRISTIKSVFKLIFKVGRNLRIGPTWTSSFLLTSPRIMVMQCREKIRPGKKQLPCFAPERFHIMLHCYQGSVFCTHHHKSLYSQTETIVWDSNTCQLHQFLLSLIKWLLHLELPFYIRGPFTFFLLMRQVVSEARAGVPPKMVGGWEVFCCRRQCP